jgi:hypothetical protein
VKLRHELAQVASIDNELLAHVTVGDAVLVTVIVTIAADDEAAVLVVAAEDEAAALAPLAICSRLSIAESPLTIWASFGPGKEESTGSLNGVKVKDASEGLYAPGT